VPEAVFGDVHEAAGAVARERDEVVRRVAEAREGAGPVAVEDDVGGLEERLEGRAVGGRFEVEV